VKYLTGSKAERKHSCQVVLDMNYKLLRQAIKERTSTDTDIVRVLNVLGIEVSREGFFKVREERTPSCKINKDGSCHDYGSGEHYGDIVALLFDGYRAFESLPETMNWLCEELGISKEDYDE